MALESTNAISGLNAANPSPSDMIGEAYKHIQLVKSVLKQTFPTIDGAITLTAAEINQIPNDLAAVEKKLAIAYEKLKQLEAATPEKQDAADRAALVAQAKLLRGIVLLMRPTSRAPTGFVDLTSIRYQFLNAPNGAQKTSQIKMLKAVTNGDAVSDGDLVITTIPYARKNYSITTTYGYDPDNGVGSISDNKLTLNTGGTTTIKSFYVLDYPLHPDGPIKPIEIAVDTRNNKQIDGTHLLLRVPNVAGYVKGGLSNRRSQDYAICIFSTPFVDSNPILSKIRETMQDPSKTLRVNIEHVQ